MNIELYNIFLAMLCGGIGGLVFQFILYDRAFIKPGRTYRYIGSSRPVRKGAYDLGGWALVIGGAIAGAIMLIIGANHLPTYGSSYPAAILWGFIGGSSLDVVLLGSRKIASKLINRGEADTQPAQKPQDESPRLKELERTIKAQKQIIKQLRKTLEINNGKKEK